MLCVALMLGCYQVYGAGTGKFSKSADTLFTLQAYALTPDQEANFMLNKTGLFIDKKSCFWDAWNKLPTLSKVVLDSASFAYGVDPLGPHDCTISMRCAYGAAGAYFLFQVIDDNFSITDASQWYRNDVVELYLADKSASTLYANPISSFVKPYYQQIGPGIAQFQIGYGGKDPGLIKTFNYNYFNDFTNAFVLNNSYAFSDAEQNLGIRVGLVTNTGNPTLREQEWFIPWSVWSGPTRGVPPQHKGNRLAMTFGYNDLDAPDTLPTAIRWRNNADPFMADTDVVSPSGDSINSVDSWGDILFGDLLNDKLIAQGQGIVSCDSVSKPDSTLREAIFLQDLIIRPIKDTAKVILIGDGLGPKDIGQGCSLFPQYSNQQTYLRNDTLFLSYNISYTLSCTTNVLPKKTSARGSALVPSIIPNLAYTVVGLRDGNYQVRLLGGITDPLNLEVLHNPQSGFILGSINVINAQNVNHFDARGVRSLKNILHKDMQGLVYAALPGAHLRIFNSKGQCVAQVVSGSDGYARISTKEFSKGFYQACSEVKGEIGTSFLVQ